MTVIGRMQRVGAAVERPAQTGLVQRERSSLVGPCTKSVIVFPGPRRRPGIALGDTNVSTPPFPVSVSTPHRPSARCSRIAQDHGWPRHYRGPLMFPPAAFRVRFSSPFPKRVADRRVDCVDPGSLAPSVAHRIGGLGPSRKTDRMTVVP